MNRTMPAFVVLGRTGDTMARIHGSPDDANHARLRAELEAALHHK
jgi:hypothetical protein